MLRCRITFPGGLPPVAYGLPCGAMEPSAAPRRQFRHVSAFSEWGQYE
ncbi:hypothetical protein [Pontiella desulfatans]|nr:hypothetical protein [Pontiella desulfatans]